MLDLEGVEAWLAANGRLREAATSEWLAADFIAGGESAAAAAADESAFTTGTTIIVDGGMTL